MAAFVHLSNTVTCLCQQCPISVPIEKNRLVLYLLHITRNLEIYMAPWNGIADCPKCGNKGTLMVSGETSTLEIDGCWVCGFGRQESHGSAQFLPIKHLRIEKRIPSAAAPGE
jgi:hypothetical protein